MKKIFIFLPLLMLTACSYLVTEESPASSDSLAKDSAIVDSLVSAPVDSAKVDTMPAANFQNFH